MGRAPSTHDERREAADGELADDTLGRRLTKEERARFAIDAWEPSLLRYLLNAEGKLGRDRER